MPRSRKYEKIIAFCISRFFFEENSIIINKIIAEGKKRNWKIQIFTTMSDLFYDDGIDQASRMIFEMMNPERFDAIMIMSESFKSDIQIRDLIARATKLNVPVISIDKYYPECIIFRFDYIKSFESIVRHMIEEHGYKDTIMISGVPGNLYAMEREMAYKKVLQENNIPFDESKVIYGGFWEEPTRIEMEKFFEAKKELPEAFICANDDMAFTLYAVLEEHGIKVPDDVAISGFDGLKAGDFSSPTLTTVSYDYAKMFHKAFELIEKRQWKDYVGTTTLVEIPLRVGESCGCKDKSEIVINSTNLLKFKRRLGQEIAFREGIHRLIDANEQTSPSYAVLESIREYMVRLTYDKLYLCTEDSFLSELVTGIKQDKSEKISYENDRMCCFCIDKNDDGRIEKQSFYLGDETYPYMEDILESDKSCMVLPIHVSEKSVGYAVLIYDEHEMWYTSFGVFFNTLMQLLSLQRKQAIIDHYEEELGIKKK